MRDAFVTQGVAVFPSVERAALALGRLAPFNSGGMTVTNSTFSGNSADSGGAIFNTGGTGTVTNSTFSGNSAIKGGAIYNYTASTLTVTNSTFSANAAGGGGGPSTTTPPAS